MFKEDLEKMKEEVKEAIQVKYEEEIGRSAMIDERLLEDEGAKSLLFEDQDIYDLLEAYVSSIPTKEVSTIPSDEKLKEAFEEILCEMTMEAEGIVA